MRSINFIRQRRISSRSDFTRAKLVFHREANGSPECTLTYAKHKFHPSKTDFIAKRFHTSKARISLRSLRSFLSGKRIYWVKYIFIYIFHSIFSPEEALNDISPQIWSELLFPQVLIEWNEWISLKNAFHLWNFFEIQWRKSEIHALFLFSLWNFIEIHFSALSFSFCIEWNSFVLQWNSLFTQWNSQCTYKLLLVPPSSFLRTTDFSIINPPCSLTLFLTVLSPFCR